MDVYVARQPIFDRRKKLYGYELLFRDGISNSFPDIDGETATSKLLSNSYLSIGLDRLTQDKMAFINFPQASLLNKVPTIFSAQSMVVEILEDVAPDPELIAACRDIAAEGFTIALDDFVYAGELQPLVDLATIIKIDFMATPLNEIEQMVAHFKRAKIKLLAEKIENYNEFKTALEMGFSYFQGYFFSKPEILSSKGIPPAKIGLLQMIQETNKKDCDFDKLEALITRDVSISYKLLRYINSAFHKRSREINAIKGAIVLLGEREIKKFISLIAAAELAAGKPDELIRASIIRARICEQLGKGDGARPDPSELFLLGLFSCIDAMLDRKMEDIMHDLPLSQPIKAALAEGRGALAQFLQLVTHYEKGDWVEYGKLCQRLGLQEEEMKTYYLDAVDWADAYSAM